jgi:hypothetical protein
VGGIYRVLTYTALTEIGQLDRFLESLHRAKDSDRFTEKNRDLSKRRRRKD